MPPPFPWNCAGGEAVPVPPRVLTIGHSNHAADMFLALLRQHDVAVLVDVRSAPYSRYAPQFNRGNLEALLAEAQITYHWAGDGLGGRPDDPTCYHGGIVRKGKIDYAAVAQQTWYQDGVQRLLEIAVGETTAIMCSEEDPRRCHRHRLIEASLRDRGADVLHIRRDGALETIDLDEAAPLETTSPQLVLMGWDA